MEKFKHINAKHEDMVTNYLIYIQKQVYLATETADSGKYDDFQDILEDIMMYHNDFVGTGLNKDNLEEWVFAIPNLTMFTSLGFFAGLRNKENDDVIEKCVQNVYASTMDIVGSLSDLMKDEAEIKNMEQC
tara:strand:- start:237 stop:629 length:393 start_codon:yes stop_codon:yes gene_type:complete